MLKIKLITKYIFYLFFQKYKQDDEDLASNPLVLKKKVYVQFKWFTFNQFQTYLQTIYLVLSALKNLQLLFFFSPVSSCWQYC